MLATTTFAISVTYQYSTSNNISHKLYRLYFSGNGHIINSMNIEALEKLLDQGQDNLLLRFGIAQALLKEKQLKEAIVHLEKALEFDPVHSASMKLLGKTYAAAGDNDKAIETYKKGIELAEQKGDIQAAKEMKVFLKRLLK